MLFYLLKIHIPKSSIFGYNQVIQNDGIYDGVG